jgi:hypothetical protein
VRSDVKKARKMDANEVHEGEVLPHNPSVLAAIGKYGIGGDAQAQFELGQVLELKKKTMEIRNWVVL